MGAKTGGMAGGSLNVNHSVIHNREFNVFLMLCSRFFHFKEVLFTGNNTSRSTGNICMRRLKAWMRIKSQSKKK